MKLQRTLKDSALSTLKANINPVLYTNDEYTIDDSMVKSLAGIYQPTGLLEKMDAGDEFKSAIALYDAYKDLSPLMASNEAFWTYLAHAELFSYVKTRWPNVSSDRFDSVNYIKRHWFVSAGLHRHSLAGLWWFVRQTIDDLNSDKYHLTKIILGPQTEDLRANLGSSTLFRSKSFTHGVLSFLEEHPKVMNNNFTMRNRYIVQYFNRLGSYRQIAYLGESAIKEELNKSLKTLMNI